MVHSQRDTEIGSRLMSSSISSLMDPTTSRATCIFCTPGCRISPWCARQCRTTGADRGGGGMAAGDRHLQLLGQPSPVSAVTRASVHRSHATASQRRR